MALGLMAGNSNSGRYSSALRKRALIKGKHTTLEPVAELPPPPTTLSDYGKELWNTVGQMLVERRLLDHLSMCGFEGYCMAMDLLRVSHKQLIEDPSNQKAKANWTTAQSNVRAWAMSFGLMPSARGRVVSEMDEVEQDDLGEFL